MRATRRDAKQYQLNLDGEAEVVVARRKPIREEAQHQALFFAWRKDLAPKYPALRWIYSTLNGIFLPPHLRAQAVEAGMERGVLDIWIPQPYDDGQVRYCGLAMDLKRLKGGSPTPEQIEWAAHLKAAGWMVLFPAGCVEAWHCLCSYLGIQGEDHWAADLQRREEFIRQMSQG